MAADFAELMRDKDYERVLSALRTDLGAKQADLRVKGLSTYLTKTLKNEKKAKLDAVEEDAKTKTLYLDFRQGSVALTDDACVRLAAALVQGSFVKSLRVSKAWNAAFSSPVLWEGRTVSVHVDKKVTIFHSLLETFSTRLSLVSGIKLPSVKLGSTTLAKLKQAAPRITYVDTGGLRSMKPQTIVEIAETFPKLVALDANDSYSCGPHTLKAVLESCRALQTFNHRSSYTFWHIGTSSAQYTTHQSLTEVRRRSTRYNRY